MLRFCLLSLLASALGNPPRAEAGPRILNYCAQIAAVAGMESFYQVSRLRYRVTVEGTAHLRPVPGRGTLVLANHPAYIDPPILVTTLRHYGLPVRPVIKDTEATGPMGWLAVNVPRSIVLPSFPDTGERRTIVGQMNQAVTQMSEVLEQGQSLLLYPAGRITREDGHENVEAKGAVKRLLTKNPGTRVLLVRTDGLFGSLFGYQPGYEPVLSQATLRSLGLFARRGVFFMPKREVTIRISEPDDFPHDGDRRGVEDYLDSFFNTPPQIFTEVPY